MSCAHLTDFRGRACVTKSLIAHVLSWKGMKVLIVDNGSSLLDDLVQMFKSYSPEVSSIEDIDISDIAQNTLVVLSGGRRFPVLWHNRQYAKEIELLRYYEGPVFGVCLGFELIGHVYGGHLSLLPRRVHASRKITFTQEGSKYFSQKELDVYESHRFTLKRTFKPLVSLATSIDGVEAVRHQAKPILGVQFHPEKLNKSAQKDFLSDITKIVYENY